MLELEIGEGLVVHGCLAPIILLADKFGSLILILERQRSLRESKMHGTTAGAGSWGLVFQAGLEDFSPVTHSSKLASSRTTHDRLLMEKFCLMNSVAL
ncbi:hypothetical protein Peur_061880 [Populus x canadensis]